MTGNLHEGSIHCMVWWRVTSGVTPTTYAPRAPVNRAQMATFIAQAIERSGGQLPAAAPGRFTDVEASVHATRIRQLAAAGIVQGTTTTTYAPHLAVTRGQMATFLARAYEHRRGEELAATRDHFRDDDGNRHEANIDAVAEAGSPRGRAA